MPDPRPIGMFDSGFGGLTVARAVVDRLPDERLVYLGDTARYPYGDKDLGEVRAFARQISDHLVTEYDVKAIVIACNTASAAALAALEAEAPVPVISVVGPGVKGALAATRNRHVGVIGTVGTIASGAYVEAIAAAAAEVEVTTAACPGLVECVERDEVHTDATRSLVERLLEPLRSHRVDTLLLGCTHYPYLADTIAEVMGPEVTLISSADETARELEQRLRERRIEPGERSRGDENGCPRMRFLSSGDVGWFREVGERLFGDDLGVVEWVDWARAPAQVPSVDRSAW